MLLYLEILTLRSTVTVGGALFDSTDAMFVDAVYSDRGALSSKIPLGVIVHSNPSLLRLLHHFDGREFHRLV